jgi:putative SOS response-associated peptidase YedK
MLVLTYDEVRQVLHSMQGGVQNPFPDWPARSPINAYPQSAVPVATSLGMEQGASPDSAIKVLTWGYPVEWQAGPVFNTRIESLLAGKGMWRASIENGRCLVPTRGFFERHATEKTRSRKTGRQVKRQYEFSLVDEPITWLAGISENGYFSVVTTEPNQFVSPVHNRMPLVLRREELPLWLDHRWASLADRSDIVLRVFPEDEGEEESAGDQLSLF